MTAIFAQSDAAALPLEDDAVDLSFCSPPYVDARTYGIGAQRDCVEWVDWMLPIVREMCRVTTGLVLVNCAGVTRDWRYQPAPEMLLSEWWKQGGECWRPAYMHRVGIPGSGGKQWLRADVEYVLAFKGAPGKIPWSDNIANGHRPKWGPGGEMSNRQSSGKRVNQWGGIGSVKGMGAKSADGSLKDRARPSHRIGEMESMIGANGASPKVAAMLQHGFPIGAKLHTEATANGEMVQGYLPPAKSNPGTLIKTIVGGGTMGSKLAHENEAPFSEHLAAWFIRGWCPPGGRVLDCFSGSGTTAVVAARMGRIGIGFDIRMSQCELGVRRLAQEEPRLIPAQ